MDVVEGLPEEFALLRRELAGITDRRFARGLVHPLEAVLMLRQAQQVLDLMCGQGFLSAIYRFGDTHPELLAGLGLRRLSLGYREVEARADGPLLSAGQQVRGHEFHWSTLEQPPQDGEAIYRVVNQGGRPDGFRSGSVWATYVHVHLGSAPGLAPRFVETCAVHSTI